MLGRSILRSVLGLALLGQACVVYDRDLLDEAGAPAGTGGSAGGSEPGTGGLSASGGSATGGDSSGGEPGSGGAGGAPVGGDGGSSPTGGSGGTGGSSGGSGGTGGTGGVVNFEFDFASNLQSFDIRVDETSGATASDANWDKDVGDPLPGSASLEVSFAGPDEKVEFTRTFSSSPLDLTDAVVTARVKLDSGLNSTPLCGYAYVQAKSVPDFVFARGVLFDLSSDEDWITISLDMANPDDEVPDTGFDPGSIVELGIAFATRSSCPTSDWQTAFIHVDSIDY